MNDGRALLLWLLREPALQRECASFEPFLSMF
jgi:hypothetical protein